VTERPGGAADGDHGLRVEGVAAGYGEAMILRDVALAVRPGELVTLLGPSGAGKTTLLRAIAGLLPLRAGAVRLDGARVDGLPPHRLAARGVTLLPEGRRLFGELTVEENLAMGAYLPRARRHAPATRALVERLFPVLAERRGERADRLSGGEQQMVALGRALMARPRYLLLDDPFLGLAGPARARLTPVLRDLAERQGLGLLVAGQHVRTLLRLAHRGAVLDEGRIVASGPGPTLLEDAYVRGTLLDLGPEAPP
jgi:branched-chain amino acid transport system ATP-binding protein